MPATPLVSMLPHTSSPPAGSFVMPAAPSPRASPAQACAEAVRVFGLLQDAVLRGSQTADSAIDTWTSYVRAVGGVPTLAKDDSVTAVLQTLFNSLEGLRSVAGAHPAGQLSPHSASSHHLDEQLGDTAHSPPARGRLRARLGNSSPQNGLNSSGTVPPLTAAAIQTPHTPAGPPEEAAALRGGSFRNKGASPANAGNIETASALAPPASALEGGLTADECEGFKLE
uniref:Uncharacterized protein n=1 Tax=Neobodo designis TaxID=312471 RepID=A0A7S1MMD1_NEODS|mmetsp:Transcript_4353/g.13930  ORF Transcript_4353/g.13930 Transcript_4353/m.13930 type:complete len:227 (+) Transcript_4353:307-987(+)